VDVETLETIKNISLIISVATSFIALVTTLTTLIVKPLRKRFIAFIKRSTNDVEKDNILKEQAEAIKREDADIKELKESVNQIVGIISELSDRIFRNEADRLRSELFDCGNRCRRRIPLSGEEYRHIQGVFRKYSKELHENGSGEDEYNFITDYFNSTFNQDRLNRKYDD
jgi:uncharacterized membrane-anchored protein YjiN (DUF445 family)